MKLRIPFTSRRPTHDGIHIVSRGVSGTVIERRAGNVLLTRLVPAGAPITVESVIDGARSTVKVSMGQADEWTQNFSSEQDCREASESLGRALRRTSYSLKNFLMSAAVAVVFVFLISPSPAPADGAASARPASNLAAALPFAAPRAEPAPSVLSSAERIELDEAVAQRGMQLAPGGTQFVVFSDPNCPFCRELEQSLVQLDPAFSPVILPLGFKPGARELSASVLCSRDPAAAWREALIEGKAPEAPACERGLVQVDLNMALFQKLKMGSTPTMVTPSGTVVVGTGSPEVIASVMSR